MVENRQSKAAAHQDSAVHQDSAAHQDSHGRSVAAWTAVGLVMFGFLLMSIAVAIGSPVLFGIGAGVVVIGAVAGKVLSAMGYGVSGRMPH